MADPTSYPRTYRAELGDRVWYFALAVAAIVGGPTLMLWPRSHQASEIGILYALSAGAVLFGLLIVWMAQGAKVVLHADAIEVFEPPGRPQRIARDAIASRGVVRPPKGRSRIVLTPRDAGAPPVMLTPALVKDAVLDAWLETIPVRP